jgi:superfamily II DNA or RNA helicase
MIQLRDYQEQALEAEAQHRADHPEETRLAIVMATGLGKGMIIAARAVRAIEDPMFSGRVLVLAHTDEIVSDLAARCRFWAGQSEFPITVGIVKAESDETEADIVVASTQTLLSQERRDRITDVGLVLVDECELYAAPEWSGVLRHFGCFPTPVPHPMDSFPTFINRGPVVPALGFTATLKRGDGQGLGTLWQDVAFSRDISWGVRHGYLVQPIGYRLEIDARLTSVHGNEFTLGVQDDLLIEAMAPARIVERWQELASNRPTIAFMPLVRSARMLSLAFHDVGVRAEVVHGDMPTWQRREALEAYADGKVQVLVNAMVLTRGFDAPKTSCVIVGRPTKSVNLGIQMAGRGLRRVPGIPVEEQDCILIYVQDATTDLFCHADLSDRPMDRKAQGALTVMEDQWDIGAELADETRFWTGQVDATEFDPLVRRSSKVWRTTQHGTPYLPYGKDGQYVFVVGTSVFLREGASVFLREGAITAGRMRTVRLHKDLPDLELAMSVAEDEAEDRGGGLGRLLADRDRPWRKGVPSAEMQGRARQLGLGKELAAIMASGASGKAGKLSDRISSVLATRALEPMVAKIKEATS